VSVSEDWISEVSCVSVSEDWIREVSCVSVSADWIREVSWRECLRRLDKRGFVV